MNYRDYLNHLKVSEYLGKEPTGAYGDIYRKFLELWDGVTFLVSNHDIYIHKGGETFAVIDLEINRFKYMVENLDLKDYLSGKNHNNEENRLFFRNLVNDYLCTDSDLWFSWAYVWSLNETLRNRLSQHYDVSTVQCSP